jgi:hypothetical protein
MLVASRAWGQSITLVIDDRAARRHRAHLDGSGRRQRRRKVVSRDLKSLG